MPITLNFNGLSVYAVWGRDLIVLPEFRNLGLGPLLIKNVLNATLNNAHAFLIAGLNDSIYQVYKKFEFTDMGYLPLYVRVNRLIPLMPERFRIKPIARFIRVLGEPIINILNSILALKGGVFNCPVSGIFETERFDRSFDKLWARARNSFQIIVKRDSDSLNWRFVDQPYGKYRIFSLKHGFDTKGYIVLREGFAAGVRLGVISDLFADAADTLTINSLIKFAINYFSSRDDIGLIRCDMLNKKFEKSIKKFGFIKVKSSLRFMFTNLHDSLDPMFAADLENWFIDYADSDLDLSGRR